MRGFGLILLAVGLLGLAGAFYFPVSGPAPDTHNALMARLGLPQTPDLAAPDDGPTPADLIAQRAMISNGAGFLAVVGAILASVAPRAAGLQLRPLADGTTENAARDVPSGVPAE
jgi:hypothetical protein